jgi:hypothetical protein
MRHRAGLACLFGAHANCCRAVCQSYLQVRLLATIGRWLLCCEADMAIIVLGMLCPCQRHTALGKCTDGPAGRQLLAALVGVVEQQYGHHRCVLLWWAHHAAPDDAGTWLQRTATYAPWRLFLRALTLGTCAMRQCVAPVCSICAHAHFCKPVRHTE